MTLFINGRKADSKNISGKKNKLRNSLNFTRSSDAQLYKNQYKDHTFNALLVLNIKAARGPVAVPYRGGQKRSLMF